MTHPRIIAGATGIGLALLVAVAGRTPAAAGEPDPLRPPAIQTESVPPVPDDLVDRLRQYQNARWAEFSGWAPDGEGMLVQTRFGNTAQLFRVYTPGGRREQKTFYEEPVRGSFLPKADDGALLYSMSRGGDEQYQIYLYEPANGRAKLLTDGSSRNMLAAVRDDGRKIVVASTQRNGRDTDLYLADPRQPASMNLLLATDGEYWLVGDWSLDGSRLLVNRYVSINETYPAVLDAESGRLEMIPIPGGGTASFDALHLTPDGKSAYLSTDARGEFRELALVDLGSHDYTWLTEDIPWDVTDIEVEPATGLAAFTVNEDGASALYLLSGTQRRRVELPLGIIEELEFSPDGTQLGFSFSRPDAPTDAYSLQIADDRLIRWTYSEVGGLDTSAFVLPERIRFPTFDERMIPAYYFQPRKATAENPSAVLVVIHGGPESQYRPYFSATDQFFLNEFHLAVVRPNVRGSAGYGKTFLKLDNAEKREDSVRDIGALLDWIAERPELDESRVAVLGGSYGGYMVLGSLVHYSPQLRAGVDIVGIASFTTFLKNTSAYRRDLRRAEYGDERDPQMLAFFDRINPLHNADRIRTDLLVAHGKNDPRVPFSEAEQIAPKVRGNGNTVWTLYADNEGHGFHKKENRDYLTAVIALFLHDQLIGPPAPADDEGRNGQPTLPAAPPE